MEITKGTDKGKRNSSIELLRIISMIMILSCHFATHGGFSFDAKLSIPRLWWNFLEMGGNFGVDIFVLISGYFLVESSGKIFNLKKIVKFWGQVFFYSLTIFLVFSCLGKCEISLKTGIEAIFPMTKDSWWFASTYFVLYLLSPFINLLLHKLDKNTYKILITFEIILWSIIPTFTALNVQGSNLAWFITLYCVAGYVRLYGLNPRFTRKHYVCFWAVLSALRYLSSIVLIKLGTAVPLVSGKSLYFYSKESVLTFLSALSFFMIFEKSKIKYNKWINVIASATFGVYLIHDSGIVRPWLWNELFRNAQYQNSLFLIPYSLGVILIVYIACTLVDLLRQNFIEKPFIKFTDRYANKLFKPVGAIIRIFKNIFFGKEK